MVDSTSTPRAQEDSRLDRSLGHPLAFTATAVILLLLFGWTFFTNADRVAPTKDPAYYTWRTDALLSEKPVRLIEIEGPLDVFAGGYRVAAPVIGGLLRQIVDVSAVKSTAFLMVGIPVLTALLLAGFAYRHRRDPLIFHAVALGVGGLLLTPPFVGYLDNLLTLFFLSAALPFYSAARTSWPARIAFGLFLLLSGLTHPTTLVIFGVVLGAMSVVRLLYRRFDIRSVLRDDGPALLSALAAFVVTLLIWKVGIWGKSAPLSEAALPPPYDKDFFVGRLEDWVRAMQPALNGPLFVVGIIGLLAAGWRAIEDDFARISILWLAPLAGVFGFLAGLTYPYYRFFNTTPTWVLLVGVGMYFAVRFFLDRSRAGGVARGALLGVAAIAVVIAANFSKGFDVTNWNDTDKGWLSAQERADLDALRSHLALLNTPERPVVFIIDTDDHSPRVYGYMKLSGNTSRYGLPHGQIDEGHMYLGSLENYLLGTPTVTNATAFLDDDEALEEDTYDHLSEETLADAREGIAESGEVPVVVVATVFNETGANADAIPTGTDIGTVPEPGTEEVLYVDDAAVKRADGSLISEAPPEGDSGAGHLAWVVAALLLLAVPGFLALKFFLPDATLADALGLVPALSIAVVTLSGIAVLAVTRQPFEDNRAWISLIVAVLVTGILGFLRLRARPEAPASD